MVGNGIVSREGWEGWEGELGEGQEERGKGQRWMRSEWFEREMMGRETVEDIERTLRTRRDFFPNNDSLKSFSITIVWNPSIG